MSYSMSLIVCQILYHKSYVIFCYHISYVIYFLYRIYIALINIVILGQQQLNLQRKFSEPAGYMGLQEVTSRRYLCMNSQGQFYNKVSITL